MRSHALAAALLAFAVPARADQAVRCARLLDMANGAYLQDALITVHNGTVASVVFGAALPAGAIDLANATCLPGLIDVHVHLTSDPRDSGYKGLGISVPRRTLIGAHNAALTLRAGFTTVRNLGSPGFADVALRDAIEAGDIAGPRVIASGPPLGITGGHCDNNLLAPEFNYTAPGVADGPWAARAKVRENVKYGSDVIKVCASGGILSKGDAPGAPQYTVDELLAIADEAHKLGRKVAAHAHGAQSIKDAIRARIDSVEHASLIDDEGIALAKQHGTFLVFDIYNDDYILAEGLKNGVLPESIEKERALGRLQRENFRKALLGGARMAFGTDAGVYPHGDAWRQFPYMVEYGMKPIEAIRAATTNAAELLGLAGKAGVVAPSAFADLIAVAGDPLADVKSLGRVTFVMKAGAVYKQ